MREKQIRVLRYTIDVDGAIKEPPIRQLIANTITPDYFYSYRADKNIMVRSAEAELYEYALEYFKIYNSLVTESAMRTIIMEADIEHQARKTLCSTLDEVKYAKVQEDEFKFHLDKLVEEYVANKTIQIFADTVERQKVNPFQAVAYTQKELADLITRTESVENPRDMTMEIQNFIKWKRHEALESGQFVTPKAYFGIPSVDRVVGGLFAGETTLLAGPESSGKSWIAQIIAYHNALERKLKVVYANRENLDQQVWQRMVASNTGVSLIKLSRGMLDEEDKKIIHERMAIFENDPSISCLLVPPSRCETVPQLRAQIEGHYGNEKPDLIVLDYLDEMQPTKNHSDEWHNIMHIMSDLKRLAIHFECPLVSPTQLNRTGAIQYHSLMQKSDNVFIMKPDPANPIKEPEEGKWFSTPGRIDFKLARARNTTKNVQFCLQIDPSRGMVADMSTIIESEPEEFDLDNMDREYDEYDI